MLFRDTNLPLEILNGKSDHFVGLGSEGQGDVSFLLYISLCTICLYNIMYTYCFSLIFKNKSLLFL